MIQAMKSVQIFFCVLFLISISTLQAQENTTDNNINIISWWGYLEEDMMKPIEKACQTSISFDEYYTNTEFLRRIKSGHYDLAIYSGAVYDTMKDVITLENFDIGSNASLHYQPQFKKTYEDLNYEKNTFFFAFSLTGFLWKKDQITLLPSDSIESIFEKAKGKTIVMIDDPAEASMLLSAADGIKSLSSNAIPTATAIEKLVGDTNIVFANSLAKIIKKDDFAFSVVWSGAALRLLTDNGVSLDDYGLLVHPSLSHLSKDLVSVITKSDAAKCVARHVTQAEFINNVAKTTGYISPFLLDHGSLSTLADKIYSDLIKYYDSIPHMNQFTHEEYDKISEHWETIKMTFNFRHM